MYFDIDCFDVLLLMVFFAAIFSGLYFIYRNRNQRLETLVKEETAIVLHRINDVEDAIDELKRNKKL